MCHPTVQLRPELMKAARRHHRLYVCICVYAYVCMCMPWIAMDACMRAYRASGALHTYMHTCMQTYILKYMQIMHAYTHTCIPTCRLFIHTEAYIHLHLRLYIYTCISHRSKDYIYRFIHMYNDPVHTYVHSVQIIMPMTRTDYTKQCMFCMSIMVHKSDIISYVPRESHMELWT